MASNICQTLRCGVLRARLLSVNGGLWSDQPGYSRACEAVLAALLQSSSRGRAVQADPGLTPG